MDNSIQDLGRERVGVLIIRYGLPCVISLLVGALYNIVDQIFIANATYLGSYGNAANTAIFPLTVGALAIAVMCGDGACAYASRLLGLNEKNKALKSVGSAISVTIISSIILMIIYIVFQDGLVVMFGGSVNEKTYLYAKEYLFYIALGIPFYMFGQAANPIIRADGNPRFAMIAILIGAITNIILDPIFIYILKWGMMGAAIATVIGQFITAVLSLIYICKMKNLSIGLKDLIIDANECITTLKSGLTSFLSQISLVLAMMAINNMIMKYSVIDPIFSSPELTQIPMAVLGIVMKFFQIVISIVVGLSAGCIPIVGFNIGSGYKKRVRDLLKLLLISEFVVGLVSFILVEFFPDQLISLFGASSESIYYTLYAEKAFRIYLALIILACINKATFIFLQGMGKVLESTILSMVREVVFGVGFALLLPVFFKLDGVLYSMPISDLITFIISVYLLIKISKELKKG